MLLSLFSFGFVSGEEKLRTFTDTGGRMMKAKILSHKGDGKVKFELANGKVYNLPITKFCQDDQEYLTKWTKANPPQLEYALKFEVKQTKVAGRRKNLGYKKVTNARYAYEVKVTNGGRDTLSDMKLEYKMFMNNEADGSYSGTRKTNTKSGTFEIAGHLPYNHERKFTTEAMNIDIVDYGYRSSRYKDELGGILIRVKNKDGKLVASYAHGRDIKGRSWND